jgi:predicted acyl esterase
MTKRSSRITAILFVLLAIGSAIHAQSLTTVMVPMRDGVRLATDCYVPAGPGPFPVILVRTIYGKSGSAAFAQEYLNLGYAVVIQDLRGRFDSEGVNNGFESDGWGPLQDGIDTLAWVRAQPQCNGKVGTVGNSALGISQILNAAAGGNIDCQLVHVAPCEFYGYVSYMGGVFLKNLVEGWTTSTGIAHTIDLYKAHPTRDSFWSYYDARSRASQVTAPGLHLGGWFDVFQQGTIDNFTTRQHDGGQGARGNQKLVIGPWGHNRSSTIGELTFPRSALPTLQPIQEMFIEHWLEGTENGVMNEAPVNYYTMGAVDEAGAPGNEWHAAGDWPPFPTVQRAYRAAAGNVLSSEAAAQDDDALTFTFDPSNPCPTRGGQNLMMAAGPMDQRPVSTRADVLRFATQPLPRPVELTGRVHARLYVSTDAPDTDFTAKFVDIYPDGREMLMLDGIQRVKFRDSDVTPSPLPIGQIGVLEVDLWSISLIVNAGHRIGMQVSSSNYPRFEVNPNNGDDFPGAHPLRVAHNTLHTGAQYPSALYLPLRDSDGDALPDYDEAAFGSDPLRADTDGDGLSDYQEAAYDGNAAAYNPYNRFTNRTGTDLSLTSGDTDGDGIGDAAEVSGGGNPIDPGAIAAMPASGPAAILALILCLGLAGRAALLRRSGA